jgi:hypothetical protein
VRVPCVVLGVCCLQKLPQIAKAPSFVHRKRRPTVDMLACVMSCRACHDCRCWCCAAVCPDLSCSNVFLFRRAAPVSCVSRRARSQRGHGCACTCVCVCVCAPHRFVPSAPPDTLPFYQGYSRMSFVNPFRSSAAWRVLNDMPSSASGTLRALLPVRLGPSRSWRSTHAHRAPRRSSLCDHCS